MASVVTLTSYRGFQDIGTVGQNVQQLAGNVQSINQLLDVGVGNTRDYTHMFVRVEHLIGLGWATLNGNQLTPKDPIYDASPVSGLPTGQSAGARAFVTDATATTFLSIVAGGGASKVPVVFDGINWVIG